MIDFVSFLLTKVYQPKAIPEALILEAFKKTVKDVNYHLPAVTTEEITKNIQANNNELAVFLYRLGNALHNANREDLKPQIHWLLKELCSCEIYFNNVIGEGFYVVHGEGTIVGSRNIIGKGFVIHHGCTIGHKKNGEGSGVIIGDNVTLYCNASILGDLKIEDHVIIGAHVLVSENIKKSSLVLSQNNNKIKTIR